MRLLKAAGTSSINFWTARQEETLETSVTLNIGESLLKAKANILHLNRCSQASKPDLADILSQ